MRLLERFPAEPDTNDTGLRFTDVLFGFVIRELFIRLNDWQQLDWYVRAHLIAGTVLVLGSYIGYRNSLKRGNFKIRFINLPLWRFAADQAMVFCYFRFAAATPDLPASSPKFPSPTELARIDANLLTWIFGLYITWDLLSLAMSAVKEDGSAKYGEKTVDGKKYPGVTFVARSLIVTIVFGAGVFVARWFWVDQTRLPEASATMFAFISAAWLFLYRVIKDFDNRIKPAASTEIGDAVVG